MNQYLLILLFFTGVLPIIQAIYRKYYLIQQGKYMSDAQVYCKANYLDLATIETYSEVLRVQNLVQSQNCISSIWIGLYNDVNSWRWSMGNVPLGSLRMWYSPNPDNYHANECCGGICPLGWFDYTCSVPLPFICFDDRYTGNSRYIYISNNMAWSQAQSYCRQYHTDLASATNATENSIIQALASGQTWFGLFRDSWKWIEKTNFTNMTWALGEPNNLLGQENCVFYVNSQAGDVQCSRLKPFLCQKVITGQKQILRVKVQSSQDVNDPAVKAAILDKITQKLSDYSNITVKWREQPDGLVFNKEKGNGSLAIQIC